MSRPTLVTLGFVLLAATPVSIRAQTETGGFVATRGTDTLVKERFTRTLTELVGQIVHSDGTVIGYKAHLFPNGTVSQVEMTVEQKGQTITESARQSGKMILVDRQGETNTIEGSTFVPSLPGSFALVEQTVRRGIAMGAASPVVPVLALMQMNEVVDALLTRPSADSVVFTLRHENAVSLRIKVDKSGRVLGARNPAAEIEVRRIP